MRYACRAAEMRAQDRAVIDRLGIPGAALMELASRGVADAVRRAHADPARRGVVVVCGRGNNGGDGWGAARWLRGWGFSVSVWSVSEPELGTDAALMARAARASGVPEVDQLGPAGLLIDAVFGTGLDREVTEPYASVIRAMNAHGAPILAVDLPSGLHADTGAELASAVRAERTVTFGQAKVGMYLRSGPERCGVIEVVDLGLAAATRPEAAAELQLPDDHDLAPLWPVRAADGHKRDTGHLLVIAGSADMVGAAVLVCRGALAGGAGLVTLAATDAMRPRLAGLPPEVMVVARAVDGLPEGLDPARFDAVAVGPGLGAGRPLPGALAAAIAHQWAADPRPWVADADALTATGPSTGPRVLTPHPGEAGRMLGVAAADVERDRLGSARRLAERGVVLLKGPRTLVVHPDELPSLNLTGSPALATGGSGDVLTGVIGALLARGVRPFDAARLAAYVHGRAGERLWARRPEGWTASDVASEVPAAATGLGLP